jgi:uncharacterized membrane protein (UPF0127 family)
MRLFNNHVNGVKVWFILLSIVFCVAIMAVLLDAPRIIKRFDIGGSQGQISSLKEGRVKIDGVLFNVLVADRSIDRQKGLSGRKEIGTREGMLFVFDTNGKQSIWMKEMLFPIDIVWISENYRIVEIKRNATPESYPEVFSNIRPARYVLELSAGSIDTFSLNGLSNIQIDINQ